MRAKLLIPEPAMLDNYSDVEYLCYIIAFHAAPTVMRRKAASLITLKNGKRPLKEIWLANQQKCGEYFPLRHICLCERAESVSVLFYHPDLLEKCLQNQENMYFLEKYGYTSAMSTNEKLSHLADRYQTGCPHEIGIFLDYPLHDVKAFAECGRKECILTGYWKVYSQEKTAIRRFREFDYSKYRILCALLDGVSPKQVAYA
ncbi:DUF3793 family protein [Clostridiales bacterium COT073_COT-073]|nr:DUF3793 family protein [Clostridiales bacterium COT073_COT-073]